ncbi:MAG: D-alanine--D-alanine ligase [Clostridia bacterium]|nr:D-alanine--D-alanine ligase [Clostridia bacterium]
MNKPIICVIFGGKSQEYEVSLRSAYSVLNALNEDKYQIVKIGITRQGSWYLYNGGNEQILSDTWHKSPDLIEIALDFNSHSFILSDSGKRLKPDKVLIVMHGENSEDGRLQGCLDMAQISYVGPGQDASAICMNKYITKLVARDLGIRVAKDILVTRRGYSLSDIYEKTRKIGYPVFVKPTCAGSSVGVTRVENEAQLKSAIEKSLTFSPSALIEEAIQGVETEVAILEQNQKIIAISTGQLSYKGEFYTYDEKYKNQKTEYIIPSKIDPKTEKSLRECSKNLFFALGLKALSRLDFFVTPQNEIIFNEVNTLPGMTDISMYPMLIKQSGISFSQLLQALLENFD